jgi:hypothetical protein
MIVRKAVLLATGVVLALAPSLAHAQASVYAEFSASDLKGGLQTNYIYGGTTGLLLDGPRLFHKVLLQANLQGRFVEKNGESLYGGTVGPRFVMPFQGKGFRPYAEFLVGFARFTKGVPVNNLVTTDNTFQVGVGATRHIRGRLDGVVDFSYAQFGAENGQYNPKTYSAGILFHLSKAEEDSGSDN